MAVLGRAAPAVTRLTPPSALFSYGDAAPPIIARFLPGQRFDVQATVRPDSGRTITRIEFSVDGVAMAGTVSLTPATALSTPATIGTRRAFSATATGVHTLTVHATQDDGVAVAASGNFEIVPLTTESGGKARNVIIMIGDGMGIAHRTAARVMLNGVSQGKALAPLAMDTLPVTGIVKTASLDSIVTDSAPGAAAYSTGNKNNNNQAGVFPDDTSAAFDNPRIESIAEYFARAQGKWLGIVTTADVTDATPAAFGGHTQDRIAGAGIADQYFDEMVAKANLRVLMGGGRRWFLPASVPGSIRAVEYDAELPEELAAGWGVPRGRLDVERDLLTEFRNAGFAYAGTSTQLKSVPAGTARLLGLFHVSHMNAALDKIYQRRGRSTVCSDYGFPDQPMLDEMTTTALEVLRQNTAGFVLMVEGGSIDKQAHNMDTERWLLEVIEFDRAVERVKAFAASVPDTLVLVTADHETGGVNIIGSSLLTQAELASRAVAGGGPPRLRDEVVGTYQDAGFPHYKVLPDGYPETTDVNRRMLIGYAANADRYEDWQTAAQPVGAPNGPQKPLDRATRGGFLVTGQIPGTLAVHTASDIALSAAGAGAALFTGVMDNTDVFFKTAQLAVGGLPAGTGTTTVPLGSVTTGNVGASSNAGGQNQRTASDRLINLSTRGHVDGGDDPMISGFVLLGSQPHRLLIRGIGPSLAAYGVRALLSDPILRIRDGAGASVGANDNWEANDNVEALREATRAVGAFELTPASNDAALLLTLPPGNYTVELAGNGTSSGTALLEVYELP